MMESGNFASSSVSPCLREINKKVSAVALRIPRLSLAGKGDSVYHHFNL